MLGGLDPPIGSPASSRLVTGIAVCTRVIAASAVRAPMVQRMESFQMQRVALQREQREPAFPIRTVELGTIVSGTSETIR